MPKLRRLSGAEIVTILGHFGFTIHSQRGSHIKLRRTLADGRTETSRFLRTMNWTRERVAQSFGKPVDSCLKKIFVHISIPTS